MQTRRILAAATLTMESLVVVFALLVAKDLSGVSRGAVVGVGVGIAVACLLVAGLLRFRWGYAVGWVLQAVVVLTGLVVPTMWLLGGVFAVLWELALHYGAKAERIRAGYGAGAGPSGDQAAGRPPGDRR